MSENQTQTRILDEFKKMLLSEHPVLKVGILHDSSRKDSKKTNVEIGIKHEFGYDGMPIRSFLRMPLGNNLNKAMTDSGAFTPEVFRQILVEDKSFLKWMKKIGAIAEEVVQSAFDQQGPGWAPWKTPGYSSRTGLILSDSQQLRHAVSSEVE